MFKKKVLKSLISSLDKKVSLRLLQKSLLKTNVQNVKIRRGFSKQLGHQIFNNFFSCYSASLGHSNFSFFQRFDQKENKLFAQIDHCFIKGNATGRTNIHLSERNQSFVGCCHFLFISIRKTFHNENGNISKRNQIKLAKKQKTPKCPESNWPEKIHGVS